MDFVLKLVAFIISFYLVHSKETIKVSKSIKLNEKMIYDCVDIYKQPSLNHPLLRNHKIQMKPSFSIPKSRKQFESKMYKKIIECPNGTVPILRNTKEYVADAQYFAEKHFNPLTVESRGTHFAGVRLQSHSLYQGLYHGIAALLSVHDLNITRGQISYGHIFAGSRIYNKDNYIQTGWMINENLYGDGRTWSFGFFKGANGEMCYNSICGFVQTSTSNSISEPLPSIPGKLRNIDLTLDRDPRTGNWWVIDSMQKTPYIGQGYWPRELFDLIDNGVKMVGVGGAVGSSPSGVSPAMGNGHRPTGEDMDAARVKNMLTRVSSSSDEFKKVDQSKLEILLDSKECYDLKRGKKQLFTYGGPGGDNCGI